MTVESTTTIDGLVADSPTSFDKKSEGDDHIRLLKAVLKASFPLFTGPLPIANDQVASKTYAESLAFSAALPGQAGNSGKFLTTDGSSASWVEVPFPVASTTVAGILYLASTTDCIDGTDATKAVTAEGMASAFNDRLGSANPLVEGTATPGLSTKLSREDHVHPLRQDIPSGTTMLFCQASAPTGWTQITDDRANNRMLRAVSGSGGGYSGTHDPTICNVVPSHTHGFTTGNQSADHTHSGNTGGQSATHSHTFDRSADGSNASTGGYGTIINANTRVTLSTGAASNDHSHGFTTGGISASHNHSGTTDNGSSHTNWQPRYINMIMATRN